MARKMQFTFNGETYVYDGSLMLPEAIAIQRATGWTKQEWAELLDKGDVIAEAALFWVLRKRRYPEQPIAFEQMDYDTNATKQTFLKRDGSPMDMEAVSKRIGELVKGGVDRDEAVKQAMDEADPEPAGETANPTVAAGTAVPAPEPPATSPAPLLPTPQPSPTTSASVPGSFPS